MVQAAILPTIRQSSTSLASAANARNPASMMRRLVRSYDDMYLFPYPLLLCLGLGHVVQIGGLAALPNAPGSASNGPCGYVVS